jgi:hypothetical protein
MVDEVTREGRDAEIRNHFRQAHQPSASGSRVSS